MNRKPFAFLVASERSGSNLLARMLGSHRRVSGPSPTHLFRLFANNAWRYGDLADDEAWNHLVTDVLENFKAKLGTWDIFLTKQELLTLEVRSPLAPIVRLYEEQADFELANMVFVKENRTAEFSGMLLRYLQDLRFIHLVRDPRDVAASWIRTSAMPGGVVTAVATWLRDQEASQILASELEGSGRWASVRYEDLVRASEPTLRNVFAFLDLPFEPVHERYYSTDMVRRDSERIDAWKNLSQPVMVDNTNRYRRELTRHELGYIEARCSILMRQFGYLPDLAPHLQTDEEPEPRGSAGQFEKTQMTTAEVAIRTRRQAALRRVLQRDPYSPSSGGKS